MAAADESMMMIEVRGKQLEEKGKSAMELLEAGEHQSVMVMTAGPEEGTKNHSILFAGTSFSDVLSYKINLVRTQHIMEQVNARGKPAPYTAYHVWKTAAEMLSDRGYIVDEPQFNAQQFGSLFEAAKEFQGWESGRGQYPGKTQTEPSRQGTQNNSWPQSSHREDSRSQNTII